MNNPAPATDPFDLALPVIEQRFKQVRADLLAKGYSRCQIVPSYGHLEKLTFVIFADDHISEDATLDQAVRSLLARKAKLDLALAREAFEKAKRDLEAIEQSAAQSQISNPQFPIPYP